MSNSLDSEAKSGTAASWRARVKPPRVVAYFLRRMREEHLTSAAAALTFSTTLSIVPALALVLVGLAAFPAFNKLRGQIQAMIVENLVPDTGLKMNDALGGVIAAAGKLTAFGVVGLMAAAILLLLTIEGQLNMVFHVVHPRPLRARLMNFWALMTVGPVVLVIGVSLYGYFAALPFLSDAPGATSLTFLLGQLLPSLLTWGVIAFIYLLVPNRRTRTTDALIGAAVAAILLAVLRSSFAFYVASMTSYRAVYGALAAVPVFLMWLYLVWLAIMAGAVVTANLPDWRFARSGYARGTAGRLVLALEILARLAALRREGKGATRAYLIKAVNAPDSLLTGVLEILRGARFVALAEGGDWVLARDLERTALADLVPHFGLGLGLAGDVPASADSEIARRLNATLRGAADSERSLLSVTIARLVALPEEPAPAAQSNG